MYKSFEQALVQRQNGSQRQGLAPAGRLDIDSTGLLVLAQDGRVAHQIRRMCEQVGLHVVGLKRIRIGNVVLGQLPVGQWRFLGAHEGF